MAVKGDPRRFAVDGSGNWINIQPEGSFVGPDLHTAYFSQVQSAVAGYWFHEYTPAKSDIVIDVGAGIGEDAVILSHLVGVEGRVHAIEAHPATFACLESTVKRSKLANVETHQLAITERDGTVSISDDAHHLANSIIGRGNGLEVRAQSLDHFIDATGHATIDLLKMNIEGAERGAMLGLDRQASKVRHMAISCHDFIADQGGGEQFRTKDAVRERLLHLNYYVTERSQASTPWEADVLFATRR
jgi:FkbM family methyltransferase